MVSIVISNFTKKLPRQGRLFQKIRLPNFTQKQVVLRKTGKNRHVFGPKSDPKLMKGQIWGKTEARFELSMPKNLSDNLLFDNVDGFEFFFNFLGLNI